MADGTHIQWTEATWNVVTGCTRVSEGCDRCYIERTPPFRMSGRRFDRDGVGGTTGVTLHPDRLTMPLRWRKPRRVFVNSLSDLFHDSVPDDYIAKVFAVMALARQHTFQVLTKRPGRMRSLLSSGRFGELAWRALHGLLDVLPPVRIPADGWDTAERQLGAREHASEPMPPLHNVWLGISVEDQHWADVRIPLLLDTPAAVRWVSAEPLLGPVDLGRWLVLRRLAWVVVGGESGPGARRMDLDWTRSLVHQCRAAGVPVFVKQLGSRWAAGSAASMAARDTKGGDPEHWPEGLRVREYPAVPRG